ncbi:MULTISPECIES: rhodanese-like domain-containing protein [unclassified Francisella]|uniref:rhodanese-like domain-containing protein n=1 Tax=unclassified Francisella TaxID=2610885 RepID=UPI002E2EC4A2|nr:MULTISPECIES: rhodanese-like domain-containing protein [unclassified Francisella]MED7819543.1 rhodanese-like domain-containing protein [Francisella sp. 19S2-4]MED7830343.1 rhodanese-like domain-containing protein [Francisella sp. 19S2-10]
MENLGYFVSQNLVFCLSFIVLLAIYIVFELTQTKKSQYTLSVTDAVTTVNRGKGVYLDLRDQEAFAKAHIIGAQNIQLDEISQKHKRLAKYQSKPIVIYGDNATKAMQELRKEGFEQVFILKGGLGAWMQASYPVKSLAK